MTDDKSRNMKIYTRTGDGGETSLYGGGRVTKHHPFMEALGAVDTCNSTIGWAISLLPAKGGLDELHHELIAIQHALFDLGAALATPRTLAKESKIEKTRFDHSATTHLEEWIDAMESELPELKTFILPGGHPAGAALHLARAHCRAAERRIVPLQEQADASEGVLRYVNRLSDYLFVAARWINHKLGCHETPWEQGLQGGL